MTAEAYFFLKTEKKKKIFIQTEHILPLPVTLLFFPENMHQNNSRKRALTPIDNVHTQKKRRALVSPKPVSKKANGGDSSSKIKVMLRCRYIRTLLPC